jgi:acetyl esterase
VHRVADMQLRGRAGPLRTRLYWPQPSATTRPRPLLVFFPDCGPASGGIEGAEVLCRHLCTGVGIVVLAAAHRLAPHTSGGAALEDALTVARWAADHAAEIDADAGLLLVGGEGFGAELAVAVAEHARDQGWPDIAHQVLIPAGPGPEMLADLMDALRQALPPAGTR